MVKKRETETTTDDRLTDGECRALNAEIADTNLAAVATRYTLAPGTLARVAAGWRARRATIEVVRRRLAEGSARG